MSVGYIRQSSGLIITGATILASHFNNEYDQLASAFDGTAGHDHSGGTGLGPQLSLTAAVSGILPVDNGGTGIAYFGVAGPTVSRTFTFPDADTTMVGTTTSQTLTNKTLTAPIISTISNTGTLTLPTSSDTLVGRSTTDTLTNKTFDSASNTFKINGVTISANTGTGANVLATSPTLTTPVLGVATTTSINKVAITAPATSATLTIADGKTATINNTLTFTGTDSSSVAFGAGGTVVYTTTTSLSSLATVGTITSGTWQGTTIANTYLPTATSAALGIVRPDNSTVTISGGVLSAVAGSAAAGSLTGTTLASNVVTSSLTAVGTIATGTWSATTIAVNKGGTGNTSSTAYTVLCGGTTSTGALQSIAGVGTSGQVLTSNGASALPTFQDATSTGRWLRRTTYASSSGTWTKGAGTNTIFVRCWGGGGGMTGNGGNTTFDTLTAGGGGGPSGNPGIGGTASGGDINASGQVGGSTNSSGVGGTGGSGAFGGGGGGNNTASGSGSNGSTPGGGAGGGNNAFMGGGGAYCEKFYTSPSSASYAVGAAGSGTFTGGVGLIVVDEYS